MNAIDFLLDGLEEALLLERDLGVRSIEVNRELLAIRDTRKEVSRVATPVATKTQVSSRVATNVPSPSRVATPIASNSPVATKVPVPSRVAMEAGEIKHKVILLHHAPLSVQAQDVIDKCFEKMGVSSDDIPILTKPPLIPAKEYVVLGSIALRKWFPGKNASPGMWLDNPGMPPTQVTYSPEYFVRFSGDFKEIQTHKLKFWATLKNIKGRFFNDR